MERAEFDKKITEWVEILNKHKGEETSPWLAPYPIDDRNFYGQQALEWITPDSIRHYCGAMGERNPLFWNEEYAKKTRWGGVIAPPTFTDSIAISWVTQREPSPVPWGFPTNPGGVRRDLFKPIRPGDKIRIVDKWNGYREVPSRSTEPRPYRMFIDNVTKSYINQNDEVAAACSSNFIVMAYYADPSGSAAFAGGGRVRHKCAPRELDAMYRRMEEDRRQGAEVLDYNSITVGSSLRTLVTLPSTPLDSVAFFAAQQGHLVAFDIRWERYIKPNPAAAPIDKETNAPSGGGDETHMKDNAMLEGEQAYHLGYQIDGLVGRMLCNWMGDDGWVEVLETRYRALPIVGDSYTVRGTVTKKYRESGKNLVDVDLRVENQDGLLIVTGTAKINLMGPKS